MLQMGDAIFVARCRYKLTKIRGERSGGLIFLLFGICGKHMINSEGWNVVRVFFVGSPRV